MKTLYLLRHAHSPSGSVSDIERHLSVDGLAQAGALGRALKIRGVKFDLVYCSPATRTRETLAGVLESISTPTIRHEKIIYDGSAGDVLSLIQHAPDPVKSLMIVGHNPTLHGLAAKLAMEKDPEPMERLMMGYPPGSLSILECPVTSWSEIQPGGNPLVDCISPAQYWKE